MRPDSLLRLWRYINLLLNYLNVGLFVVVIGLDHLPLKPVARSLALLQCFLASD